MEPLGAAEGTGWWVGPPRLGPTPTIVLKPSPCAVPPAPPPAHRINSFLDSVDVGDLIVKGDLEAYSCEAGGGAPAAAAVLSCLATSPQGATLHCPGHTMLIPCTLRRPPLAGKLAGLDKKLSRSLEEEVAAGGTDSPSYSLSKSPVGPLQEGSSRKTLVYLILTLNHIYPDYDFSLLRAHHFKKEEGVGGIEEVVDAHLVEASKVGKGVAGCLWLGLVGAAGGAPV